MCVARIYGSFLGSWIRKNSDGSAFLSFCKLSYVPEKLSTHNIITDAFQELKIYSAAGLLIPNP